MLKNKKATLYLRLLNNEYFMTIKYRDYFKKISSSSIDILNKLSSKRGFDDGLLFAQWKDIVGEEIANITKPMRIRSGVLIISCDDAGFVANFNYFRNTIIDRVNNFLGEQKIKDIRCQ